MRLYVLSDLHVEFEAFDPPKIDADVVVLAGDIHVRDKGLLWAKGVFADHPVLYVLGNHEYYRKAYRIGRTRIICNPRGYPDERNEHFRPDFVVEM